MPELTDVELQRVREILSQEYGIPQDDPSYSLYYAFAVHQLRLEQLTCRIQESLIYLRRHPGSGGFRQTYQPQPSPEQNSDLLAGIPSEDVRRRVLEVSRLLHIPPNDTVFPILAALAYYEFILGSIPKRVEQTLSHFRFSSSFGFWAYLSLVTITVMSFLLGAYVQRHASLPF